MGLQPSATMLAAAAFAVLAASLIMLALGRWADGPRAAPVQARRRAAPAMGGPRGGALPGPPGADPAPGEDRATFLFEAGALVEASPAARRLLGGRGRDATDLGAVLAALGRRFGGGLAARLAALPEAGRLRLEAEGGGVLEAEADDGALRLTIHPGRGGSSLDRLRLDAAEDELATLRALALDAPQLIWKVDGEGALAWANRAYLALDDLARPPPPEAGGEEGEGLLWPARPLFEPPQGLAEGQTDQRRLTLALPGKVEPQWFEVTSVRRGDSTLHFAVDAGGLVAAEQARKVFVQTLTKTFAHLATGLAIFDRGRRLVLFNPAFMEFSGLPITFLSGRPLVHSVLDRLRDAKILPEPRDYATWRDEVAALEAAAASGTYLETWTLPGGATWRVTGRPHPDGAIAFLFEDISDEVALTRRFRAELDTARAALDSLSDALAVFGPTGQLLLWNRGYARLWGPPDGAGAGAGAEEAAAGGDEDGGSLTDACLAGEAARWEGLCEGLPLWEEGRRSLEAPLRLRDGRALLFRLSPLSGGTTLARFSEVLAEAGAEAPAPAAPAATSRARTRAMPPLLLAPQPACWDAAPPGPRAEPPAPMPMAVPAEERAGFASRRDRRSGGRRAPPPSAPRPRLGLLS